MEQTSYVIYGDAYEFEDVLLCAFRYAINRNTYIVEEVTSWFKNNSHLLDGNERMYRVMLHDLNNVLDGYSHSETIKSIALTDYETLVAFREWLIGFGKGYGWYLKGE